MHETGRRTEKVEGVHMAKSKTKKASTKKAKVEEVDEEDDDDLELEELDEDEAEDTQPKKSKKGSDDEVAFGASDLAALLSEKTGKKITARDLRTQLRRMARRGDIERDIVAGNKSRYSWSGPNDPEVKKIIKAVLAGEMEDAKKEQLAKLKEQKAKKDAKKKKGKKAAAKVVEEDDDDDDDDGDDDDE